MLKELSKEHEQWIRMALSICKNNDLAKDLVQDMYIKLYNTNKQYTDINKWYVYRTLLNLFLNDQKRQNKTISLELLYDIEVSNKDERLELRKMINQALNELNVFDSTVLLETHERSLRKCQEHLNIPFMTLHYRKHKALDKLKESETIKEYKKHG